jgi:hypothetical protein
LQPLYKLVFLSDLYGFQKQNSHSFCIWRLGFALHLSIICTYIYLLGSTKVVVEKEREREKKKVIYLLFHKLHDHQSVCL